MADARSAIKLAHERGLTFLSAPAVMATNRFRWLKQQIASGWLGRPTLAVAQMANMGPASWRDYKGDPAVFYSAAVGPALDTGVYVLHAITGLFGPARRVEAFGGITIPRRPVLIPGREGQVIEVQAPDQILIHLDFGITASPRSSPRSPPRVPKPLHSSSTESEAPSASHRRAGTTRTLPSTSGSRRTLRRRRRRAWTEARPPGSSRTPHMVQAGPEHFASACSLAGSAILTAEPATHVLEIILAASRSIQEGRAIEAASYRQIRQAGKSA